MKTKQLPGTSAIALIAPVRGETPQAAKENLQHAAQIVDEARKYGVDVLFPAMWLTQCYDDSIKKQRDRGIWIGQMIYLDRCASAIVDVRRDSPSTGMLSDIYQMESHGVFVTYIHTDEEFGEWLRNIVEGRQNNNERKG